MARVRTHTRSQPPRQCQGEPSPSPASARPVAGGSTAVATERHLPRRARRTEKARAVDAQTHLQRLTRRIWRTLRSSTRSCPSSPRISVGWSTIRGTSTVRQPSAEPGSPPARCSLTPHSAAAPNGRKAAKGSADSRPTRPRTRRGARPEAARAPASACALCSDWRRWPPLRPPARSDGAPGGTGLLSTAVTVAAAVLDRHPRRDYDFDRRRRRGNHTRGVLDCLGGELQPVVPAQPVREAAERPAGRMLDDPGDPRDRAADGRAGRDHCEHRAALGAAGAALRRRRAPVDRDRLCAGVRQPAAARRADLATCSAASGPSSPAWPVSPPRRPWAGPPRRSGCSPPRARPRARSGRCSRRLRCR